jgi:hypothetical protein
MRNRKGIETCCIGQIGKRKENDEEEDDDEEMIKSGRREKRWSGRSLVGP